MVHTPCCLRQSPTAASQQQPQTEQSEAKTAKAELAMTTATPKNLDSSFVKEELLKVYVHVELLRLSIVKNESTLPLVLSLNLILIMTRRWTHLGLNATLSFGDDHVNAEESIFKLYERGIAESLCARRLLCVAAGCDPICAICAMRTTAHRKQREPSTPSCCRRRLVFKIRRRSTLSNCRTRLRVHITSCTNSCRMQPKCVRMK